jgi:hypothetical protein
MPFVVNANRIILDQDWGDIRYWRENKYIWGDDLSVDIHLKLSLSKIFYNFSNNYTFEFYLSEPSYTGEPVDYNITVYRECGQISLLPFQTLIGCENNYTNFTDKYNPIEKAHIITIFQERSIREWTDYDILISYKLPNFVKRKGKWYYYSRWYYLRFFKDCDSYGTQYKCPRGNTVIETIYLTNPDYLLEKYPDFAQIDMLKEIRTIELEGLHDKYEIWFINVKETEFWTPLKWVLLGFILGLIPYLIEKRSRIKKLFSYFLH